MAGATVGEESVVAILVVLILLALAFGIGAVIKGILWIVLIAAVLLIIAAYTGVRTLRGRR